MLETTIYAWRITKSGGKEYRLVVVQDKVWPALIRRVGSVIYGLRTQGYEVESIKYPGKEGD